MFRLRPVIMNKLVHGFVAVAVGLGSLFGMSAGASAKPRPIRTNAEGGIFIPPLPETNPIYIIGNPPDILAPAIEAAAEAEKKEQALKQQQAAVAPPPEIVSTKDMKVPRLFH